MNAEAVNNLRALRHEYSTIRKDLSLSLRISKKNSDGFDQFYRVTYAITDLLLAAFECVEDQPEFDVSLKLASAFKVMDTCINPKDGHQTVLFKFARSFILFMDNLNGSQVTRHPDHPSLRRVAIPRLAEEHMAPKRPRIMPNPALASQYVRVARAVPVLNQPRSNVATPSAVSTDQKIKSEEDADPTTIVGSASTATTSNGTPGGAKIKEEIEDDYEFDCPQQQKNCHLASQHTGPTEGVEVKEEMIKEEALEEPLEEPIADTVSIGGYSASSSDVASTSTSSGLRRKQDLRCSPPPSPPQVFQPVQVLCHICNVHVPEIKLEHHAKSLHKDHWLEFVHKCPEEQCDFRSASQRTVLNHHSTIHTKAYYRRLPMMQHMFPASTKCPYCNFTVTNLTIFVKHMEEKHKRLCAYEPKLLMCATCHMSFAHTWELLLHWIKKNPMCVNGVRFNYLLAKTTIMSDNAKRLEGVKERGIEWRGTGRY